MGSMIGRCAKRRALGVTAVAYIPMVCWFPYVLEKNDIQFSTVLNRGSHKIDKAHFLTQSSLMSLSLSKRPKLLFVKFNRPRDSTSLLSAGRHSVTLHRLLRPQGNLTFIRTCDRVGLLTCSRKTSVHDLPDR